MSIANKCYFKTDEKCERYPTTERPDVQQPNTLNDIYSDTFGNEFYNYSKTYVRRDINCQVVTTSPPTNPKDRGPGELYVQELNGGDYVRNGIDNQPCTSTDPTDGLCNVYTPNGMAWERKLYDNTDPNEQQDINRNLYDPRDYIRRDTGCNLVDTTVCPPEILYGTGPTDIVVNISDLEFVTESGLLIQAEHQVNLFFEPEVNTRGSTLRFTP